MAELYRRKPKEDHPRWKGGPVEKRCIVCNKPFFVTASKFSKKCCSSECAHKSRRLPTKLLFCRFCNKEFVVSTGHPEKRFCSHSCYQESIRGSGSIHWKGGKTPRLKILRNGANFKQWRFSVFEKDNWTCQKCGRRDGSEIHPHHIKSFSDHPKRRFDVNNGITLCKTCHIKEHHRFFGKRTRTLTELRRP